MVGPLQRINLVCPLTEQDKNLTLALGTARVSTLDMASAYSIFANNGLKVTPHAITKVVDQDDNDVVDVQVQKQQVIKQTTAYLINDMLRSVVTNGTGYAAKIDNWAVAGKTGTTSLPSKYGNVSGNPDAWFAGYTPDYAGVVWMGYDSNTNGNQYLHEVYGGSYPAQIWKKVMTAALQDKSVQTKFQKPDGIVSGEIDTRSGLLPSPLTPPQYIQNEIAAEGNFPTEVSNIWGGTANGQAETNPPDQSSTAISPANGTSTSKDPNSSTSTDPSGSSTTAQTGQPTTGTTTPSTESTGQTTDQTQTPTTSQTPTPSTGSPEPPTPK